MKKLSLETWMGILVLVCMFVLATRGTEHVLQTSGTAAKEIVLIDPGHGGCR